MSNSREDDARQRGAETKRFRTQRSLRESLHDHAGEGEGRPLRELNIAPIAEDAGVSTATLYNHYPTKEDLIVETVRADVGEKLQVEFSNPDAPELRRRLNATRYLVGYAFDNPAIAKHLVTVISDFPERDFITPYFDASLQASGVEDPYVSKRQAKILTLTILQAGVQQPREGDRTAYRSVVRTKINQMVMGGISAAPQA